MILPPQFMALGVYMLVQYLAKNADIIGPIEAIIGAQAVSWLPVVCALVAFYLGNTFQQAAAKKATGALIGQKAPDFTFEIKTPTGITEKNTLSKLVESSKLPTVVDFYQNF